MSPPVRGSSVVSLVPLRTRPNLSLVAFAADEVGSAVLVADDLAAARE